MTRQSFVQLDDIVEVGDEVVFTSKYTNNLVRACVAKCAVSPLGGEKLYRVVDSWRESFEPDAGWWIPHGRLYSISSLRHEGEALRSRTLAWLITGSDRIGQLSGFPCLPEGLVRACKLVNGTLPPGA
jgi:hypothetical protein